MFWSLFLFALHLDPKVDGAVAVDVAAAAYFATEDVEDLGLREELAFELVEWSYRESRWNLRAVSPTGDHGAMQEQPRWMTVPVEEVMASYETAFSQALLVWFDGLARCGTRSGAWSYYAGGACDRRRTLVKNRMREAEWRP